MLYLLVGLTGFVAGLLVYHFGHRVVIALYTNEVEKVVENITSSKAWDKALYILSHSLTAALMRPTYARAAWSTLFHSSFLVSYRQWEEIVVALSKRSWRRHPEAHRIRGSLVSIVIHRAEEKRVALFLSEASEEEVRTKAWRAFSCLDLMVARGILHASVANAEKEKWQSLQVSARRE